MFRDEIVKLPGKAPRPIMFLKNKQLLQAYKSILRDTEGAGAYGPVAEGIRSEWQHRSLNMAKLNKIEQTYESIRKGRSLHKSCHNNQLDLDGFTHRKNVREKPRKIKESV